MGTLTIRGLDDDVTERLRIRAAKAGHSIEEEARRIIVDAIGGLDGPALLSRAKSLFGPRDGVNLDEPERDDRPGPHLDP